ncbi:exodeoxyribonuclease VII large subunit [Sulfurospirillum arcachonense]|uniref:exodeoxyribonuclease VII large subunit n=1 Tax=Sulfurospirillum arcachonense TaxID=57666 RepID=UPI00046AE32B|nr:exodeoxyribonuclease VII large subunit [Sulfurospirillum arcachonense]
MNSLSVSSLNNQIKSLLETTFLHVSVEGEVSRITFHNSGHVYFTLKDENSTISCVMFRANAMKMKFRLEEGMSVVLHGSVSVYTPRGSYQINCTKIEPAGAGALALAYEQLKKKLLAKGYFENKKVLPKSINSIALVTSATGAALQDMLHVASKRWPLVKITVIDTIVQGESSAQIIAQNIQRADALHVDVIIVGRGGGSIEDLWGFNEEVVADALFHCVTPVVSAVGHEIDYVISDFVADLRAPTPSAAMEMVLPDKTEMLMRLDDMSETLNSYIKRVIYNKQEKLDSLNKMFITHSFESKIDINEKEVDLLTKRFEQSFQYLVENRQNSIDNLQHDLNFSMQKLLHVKENMLNSLQGIYAGSDPSLSLKEGVAQIVVEGKRSTLKALHVNDIFELQSQKESVVAKVISKNNIK